MRNTKITLSLFVGITVAVWLTVCGKSQSQDVGGQVNGNVHQPFSAKEARVLKSQSIDERLLFFPLKFPEGDWLPTGLTYEDVMFTSADGTRLHGWYCPCPHPRGVVLLMHGNAGHVASRAAWLRYLQQTARLSVFIFDYRGYGKSAGTPTIAGVLQDARSAREKLRELACIRDSDVILMGESLGGAVAVQQAVDAAPRGLVIQSSFSSLKDVAKVHFPGFAWLVSNNKLNSEALISKYHGPLLQSHGERDRTIPLHLAEKLFQTANQPKSFVKLVGVDHNDWINEQYLNQLDLFIDNLQERPR